MAGRATRPRRPHPRSATRRARRARSPRATTSTAPSCMFAALFALSATAPHLVARAAEPAARRLRRSSPRRTSSTARGLGPLVSAQAKAAAARRRAGHLHLRRRGRRSINVIQVGGKPHMQALKPDPKRLNPLSGFKNIYGPNALFEAVKNVFKVAAVGAVTALGVLPKLDQFAALVGMPPRELMPTLAHMVLSIAQRAGDRLPAHRARRLRLPALPHGEVAEDGQAGGQGGAQAAPSSRPRSARRDPPPPDAGRARPHDGRRPDRGRRRHEPDPLRRRAEVRRREGRAPRSSPRAPTSSPRRSASSPPTAASRSIADPPLARSLHASVEVGQHDPRGALPGRRRAPRLRLPHAPAGGLRMNAASCPEADQAHRPARRRGRRPRRRDDGRPAAAVAARPVHHDEHLGGADDRRRDDVPQQALEFSSFPSLLLLTTLFRLAINVSVTRLILLHGDAGHVVEGVRRLRRRRQRRRRPRDLPHPRS